jgi:hypothetical protein
MRVRSTCVGINVFVYENGIVYELSLGLTLHRHDRHVFSGLSA